MGSGQNKPSWRVHRGIRLESVPSKPVVFCGIAKPRNFAAQLKSAGIDSAAEKFYRDHHTYTEHDVDNLLRLLQVTKAGGFVTTEKDAINLGRHISKLQPLSVVSVTMELQDADDAVDTMLRIIQDRRCDS
jgi:tetraacyldisaccharide 4'-kinase